MRKRERRKLEKAPESSKKAKKKKAISLKAKFYQTVPSWEYKCERLSRCMTREMASKEMMQRLNKEHYLHTFWTGRDRPQLKYFPTGLNKDEEKAGKWEFPLPKVYARGQTELLTAILTGKRKKKTWERTITTICFAGDGFTRKSPK